MIKKSDKGREKGEWKRGGKEERGEEEGRKGGEGGFAQLRYGQHSGFG